MLDYLLAKERPLDLDRAVAAIKLRRAAEIYCTKSNLERFKLRLPKSQQARLTLEQLVDMPIAHLIDDVRAHPQCYSRTLLTNAASIRMLAALNIDIEQYKQGIHAAGLYEGLHSVAGRVVSTAAALASLGVSQIPGSAESIKILGKVVKILSHELPPNLVNPLLTGKLRTVTDVKESFLRVGGQPVVMPQIEKSPDMGEIVRTAAILRQALDQAMAQFEGSIDAAERERTLAALVPAFMALHELVDRSYRRRIGLNRTQTYSKGWGMAVNGVGVAGAVVSATVPVVGQIVGPVMLGATIPLQWGAGYLDERRNKHRYNFRANVKWADFLLPQAAHRHFMALRAEDVSEPALRQSFVTQPEIQIAAIREVYEDAIATLVKEQLEVERKIAGGGRASLMELHRRKGELAEQIAMAVQDADDFESFDLARWNRIDSAGMIGRCLDDLGYLEKANRHARLRKPGESAQIVQRYVQAFQGGISTGTSLPIVDALTATDALHVPGDSQHLLPGASAGAVTAGVTGGAVFTAATGEVRVSKADNKKILSDRPPSALQVPPVDDPRWSFDAGGRRVNLRGTAAYRQFTYTRRDEFILLGRAIRHGLTSGPIGLINMARARGWPQAEVSLSRKSLRRALDLLGRSGLERTPAPGKRANTISAMKDELYDYPAARALLAPPDA